MTIDINDSRTWPGSTVVVRGGTNTIDELRESLRSGPAFSVVSRPDQTFEELAACVPNNQIRRTTVRRVLQARATLVPTFGNDEPPSHCDLSGLTAEQLDTILDPKELNPVPKERRWRGSGR